MRGAGSMSAPATRISLAIAVAVLGAIALATPFRIDDRQRQRLDGRARMAGGAPVITTPLFRLLPPTASLTECDGAALLGTQGEPVATVRPSIAYCQKADGTLVLLSNNQPRVSNKPGFPGVLIEGQATNLALRSQEFDNASWAKLQAGGLAVPVVTADQATAPDGTLTADKVDFPAVSSGGTASILRQSITTAVSGHRGSIYMKGVSGNVAVWIADGNSVTTPAALCSATSSTWTRCDVEMVPDGSHTFDIGTNLNNVNQAATPAQSVYIWGAQLEATAFPTSYIPTAGTSAIRQADVLSASLPVGMLTAVGCAGVKAVNTDGSGTTGNRVLIAFGSAGSSPAFYRQNGSTTNTGVFDGTNNPLMLVWTVGTAADWVVVWSVFAMNLKKDGIGVGGSFPSAFDGTMLDGSLSFGMGNRNSGDNFYGYLGNVRLGDTITGCDL